MIKKLIFLMILVCLFSGCSRGMTTQGTHYASAGALPNIEMGLVDGKCYNDSRFNDQQFKDFKAIKALTPPSIPHREGRAYALVIGIDEYNNQLIPPLDEAANDANRVQATLKENGYIVKSLINKDATSENILNWLKFLACLSQEQDTILVYYAGHGTTLNDAKGSINTNCYREEIEKVDPNLIEDPCITEKIDHDFYIVPYWKKGPGCINVDFDS